MGDAGKSVGTSREDQTHGFRRTADPDSLDFEAAFVKGPDPGLGTRRQLAGLRAAIREQHGRNDSVVLWSHVRNRDDGRTCPRPNG